MTNNQARAISFSILKIMAGLDAFNESGKIFFNGRDEEVNVLLRLVRNASSSSFSVARVVAKAHSFRLVLFHV